MSTNYKYYTMEWQWGYYHQLCDLTQSWGRNRNIQSLVVYSDGKTRCWHGEVLYRRKTHEREFNKDFPYTIDNYRNRYEEDKDIRIQISGRYFLYCKINYQYPEVQMWHHWSWFKKKPDGNFDVWPEWKVRKFMWEEANIRHRKYDPMWGDLKKAKKNTEWMDDDDRWHQLKLSAKKWGIKNPKSFYRNYYTAAQPHFDQDENRFLDVLEKM